MADFIYNFDTGLYDIANESDIGYPWGSGPTPIKNTTGFTHNRKGAYYAEAGGLDFTGSLLSPLSDGNAGMEFLTGGKLNDGSAIIGAIYDYIPAASAANHSYYHIFKLPTPNAATDLPIMRISAKYHGKKIFLVTNNRQYIGYTIVHKGASTADVMSPAAGLSGFGFANGPEVRRLAALGYV